MSEAAMHFEKAREPERDGRQANGDKPLHKRLNPWQLCRVKVTSSGDQGRCPVAQGAVRR